MIRNADDSDTGQIIRLMSDVFSSQGYFHINRNLEWWRWKFEKNVFGKPLVLIAENQEKTVVGARIFWPWRFTFRGQTLKSYQAVDTVVHPQYRRMGLFTQLVVSAVEQAIKENIDCIYNFPNQQSLAGYLKLGWEYVSRIHWWIKPLRHFNILLSLGAESKAIPLNMPEEYKLRHEVCFSLSEKKNFSPLIKTEISPEYFVWRYLNHPVFDYGYCDVKDERRNKLTAIFMMNQLGKRKELFVLDLVGKENLRKKLFVELIHLAKKLGADYIASAHTPHYTTNMQMMKLGFIKLRKKNFVVLPLKYELEDTLISIKKWKMVLGMHDAI